MSCSGDTELLKLSCNFFQHCQVKSSQVKSSQVKSSQVRLQTLTQKLGKCETFSRDKRTSLIDLRQKVSSLFKERLEYLIEQNFEANFDRLAARADIDLEFVCV